MVPVQRVQSVCEGRLDRQTDRQTDRQRGVVPVQKVQSVCEGCLDRQTKTDRQTDNKTGKRTDEQMDRPDAGSRSRCRERRLNKFATYFASQCGSVMVTTGNDNSV